LPRTPALVGWGRSLACSGCREAGGVMIVFHQVCGRPDGVRVVLFGAIDLAVREDLRHVLSGVVAGSPGVIDLDLHHVTFLDCSGISEFIRAYLDAYGSGHMLTVSRPRGIVRRLMELTGVLAVLMPAGQADVPQLLDQPHSA
jgi:anti-sigma B factor antagonist